MIALLLDEDQNQNQHHHHFGVHNMLKKERPKGNFEQYLVN